MASRGSDLAGILTEFHTGTAMLAAFILHVLEENGLVSSGEAAKAIREAANQIPDEYAGEPRFAGLVALRVLLDDPQMKHTTPFDWKATGS